MIDDKMKIDEKLKRDIDICSFGPLDYYRDNIDKLKECGIDLEYLEIVLPDYFDNKRYRYSYSDYPTIDKITEAINKDERNKVFVSIFSCSNKISSIS